jgi:hypothetical protein
VLPTDAPRSALDIEGRAGERRHLVQRAATQTEGMMPRAIDAEDLDLLNAIAAGTTRFGPVQDEPSDSPRWVGQVERLRRLEREGFIRMPEPDPGDQPGYAAGVGPCELTTRGRKALENVKA